MIYHRIALMLPETPARSHEPSLFMKNAILRVAGLALEPLHL